MLVGKRPAKPDNRTTALLAGSVTALQTLGAWDYCAAHAAPLKTMRIVDDTGRIWRAPEVSFDASEIELEAFGYNIENRYLVDALERRARALPNLQIIEDEVRTVLPQPETITVELKDGGASLWSCPRRKTHRETEPESPTQWPRQREPAAA